MYLVDLFLAVIACNQLKILTERTLGKVWDK